MTTINIHDAKTNLSRLLARVERGEEIVISRAGAPIAKLVRYRPARGKRRAGLWKGLVRISDDFDAPLPESIQAAFEGRSP